MRYTQYTHKVSIPMRKELYEFLESLPRGSRTDMGRIFFLYVYKILNEASPTRNKDLRRLCKGNYVIQFPKEEEHENT